MAGTGIDHSTVARLSNKLDLEKGHGPLTSNKYFGGEVREECGGNLATIAIAGESTLGTWPMFSLYKWLQIVNKQLSFLFKNVN